MVCNLAVLEQLEVAARNPDSQQSKGFIASGQGSAFIALKADQFGEQQPELLLLGGLERD
jgi:hypothetical protein